MAAQKDYLYQVITTGAGIYYLLVISIFLWRVSPLTIGPRRLQLHRRSISQTLIIAYRIIAGEGKSEIAIILHVPMASFCRK